MKTYVSQTFNESVVALVRCFCLITVAAVIVLGLGTFLVFALFCPERVSSPVHVRPRENWYQTQFFPIHGKKERWHGVLYIMLEHIPDDLNRYNQV